ncbi:hypothetical protein A8990_101370 [Paenibacillus taihuensis]|uniref:Uncharacterized protein n=1 Tax=Paenibacillus taihuensis TaxID=1156355 RepID=A0A3D9SPS9_9BACL|nr:hypothetical protein A8990_101370 [Paenibacillus taihuensis]
MFRCMLDQMQMVVFIQTFRAVPDQQYAANFILDGERNSDGSLQLLHEHYGIVWPQSFPF